MVSAPNSLSRTWQISCEWQVPLYLHQSRNRGSQTSRLRIWPAIFIHVTLDFILGLADSNEYYCNKQHNYEVDMIDDDVGRCESMVSYFYPWNIMAGAQLRIWSRVNLQGVRHRKPRWIRTTTRLSFAPQRKRFQWNRIKTGFTPYSDYNRCDILFWRGGMEKRMSRRILYRQEQEKIWKQIETRQ